jgi:hypothetical protein
VNYDHKPAKRLIFGMSGSGKSTLFLSLLAKAPYRWKFVFDPELEAARKLGWQAAGTVEGLCWLLDQKRPVVFCPEKLFPSDYAGGFDFFCRFTLAQSRRITGPKLFACDELQEWTDFHAGGIPESCRELLNVGRREEVDFLLAAQSANDVHSIFRRQLTELYVFKIADSDTAAARRLAEMGLDPEAVKALPHASQGRVGYFYRNSLKDQTERIEYAFDAPRKGSVAAPATR